MSTAITEETLGARQFEPWLAPWAGLELRVPGRNRVILVQRSGSGRTLRYGLVGAEVRVGFLRPLEDSLDGSAGNAELLADASMVFPACRSGRTRSRWKTRSGRPSPPY